MPCVGLDHPEPCSLPAQREARFRKIREWKRFLYGERCTC